MPYEIKSVPPVGFKVCKKDAPTECFSKRGLPYKRALAQLRAIIISENGIGITQSRSSKKVSKKNSKKPIKKTSKKVSKKLKPKKPSKKIGKK